MAVPAVDAVADEELEVVTFTCSMLDDAVDDALVVAALLFRLGLLGLSTTVSTAGTAPAAAVAAAMAYASFEAATTASEAAVPAGEEELVAFTL